MQDNKDKGIKGISEALKTSHENNKLFKRIDNIILTDKSTQYDYKRVSRFEITFDTFIDIIIDKYKEYYKGDIKKDIVEKWLHYIPNDTNAKKEKELFKYKIEYFKKDLNIREFNTFLNNHITFTKLLNELKNGKISFKSFSDKIMVEDERINADFLNNWLKTMKNSNNINQNIGVSNRINNKVAGKLSKRKGRLFKRFSTKKST